MNPIILRLFTFLYSMVALQGDAEKLVDEAEQIAARLKEKADEDIDKDRETIVTNGYFGDESTGFKKT